MAQYSSAPYSGDLALFALSSEQVYVHGQMHLGSNSTFLDTGYASIANASISSLVGTSASISNASISSLVGTSASISVGTIATLASRVATVTELYSSLTSFTADSVLYLGSHTNGRHLATSAPTGTIGAVWVLNGTLVYQQT